ncbi:hypothetical protein G4Y79_18905 [Phototrophicus methaneseepsis]|uniref:Uncharacterized protein n=1 Tax=Phototrophicus methaneseepsis TaxID=2710758 RepID=A0A7S8E7G0_9CHLR|nr:hypothetical protein [Phototrophicus methaneseepsis]QPC81740.1 hypothetical protein G4Y79_18905 [Phototrophicus methaneseepsis]
MYNAEQNANANVRPNTSRWILLFFIGMVAWTVQLVVGYVAGGLACSINSRMPFFALSIGGLLVAAVGIILSVRTMRREGSNDAVSLFDTDRETTIKTFLGIGGVILNSYFLALILFTGVSAAFFPACPYISMPLP